VKAVDPSLLVAGADIPAFSDTPRSPSDRARPRHEPGAFVIAAGKAAWTMAHAFVVRESMPVRGGIVAGPRVGGAELNPAFEWFDAGHPFPNDASVAAGQRALALARQTREEDALLVVLLSGGASALLVAPAAGVTLEDKVSTGRVLMRAGAAIDALNCVRKHLSDIKGGQLAAVAGRSITLAISDVHGPVPDDPSVIGSGPTVADPTTFADARAVIQNVDAIPDSVRARLQRGAEGSLPETIKDGDPRLNGASYAVIGTRSTALNGARAAAEAQGYVVAVVEEPLAGESRQASRDFIARARAIAADSGRPLCVLAAGETTVTVTGDGLGGRNQEFVLAATPSIGSLGRAAVLASAGTDGIDGPTPAAGALVDSTTLRRSQLIGLDWESTLARNDAYHFFQPLGDLLMWGPTGTNVGDVQVLLIA
jgi:hydroxypyruvate reductase